MACSKLKVPATPSTEFTDGVAFTFHFSRGAHLSLVAVDIKDGVPKLRFAPAQNVPALTEEDVAIIVKLTLDGKRPEFFYEGFHPAHPFFRTGRLYKSYRPGYLRDTSIGETLAEADWAMKCLHVGVRSDKEKKHFWPWNKTSNLTGLRTRKDFGEELPHASIIMTCDSVNVEEEADELYFAGQPKMRIDCVRDGKNVEYSKYITGIFNSVAYHDEPLFLKVQEIVKLVSAVEWLHKKLQEKDMKFSRTWVNKHLNKPTKSTSQLVEPLTLNGKTWDELTVPCPCTALYSPESDLIEPPVTGGVSTQSYSTNHVSHTPRTKHEVTVPAGKQVTMKYSDTPKPKATPCPTKDVGTTTPQSEMKNALHCAGFRNGAGQTNIVRSSFSIFDENGMQLVETKKLVSPSKKPLPSVIDCAHELKELRRDGKEGAVIKEHMRLLPEYVKGENPLVAACTHGY